MLNRTDNRIKLKRLNVELSSVGVFGELMEEFDVIFYDLTNSKWEAIRINAKGWEIDKHPPFVFRRYGGELPQVYPDRDYTPDILDQYFELWNFKPEYKEMQKLLQKVKHVTDLWPKMIHTSIRRSQKFLLNHISSKIPLIIIYADLVGSTRMSMTLPIDNLVTIIRAFTHDLSYAVDSYDGYVLKYVGDAVISFFPSRANDNHKYLA